VFVRLCEYLTSYNGSTHDLMVGQIAPNSVPVGAKVCRTIRVDPLLALDSINFYDPSLPHVQQPLARRIIVVLSHEFDNAWMVG